MSFTPEQTKALAGKLSPANVKKNPKGYDYIEAWHAIAEMNRIFGHDGWDREMIRCIQCGEPYQTDSKSGPVWRVAYWATVRVRIHAGDRIITRDGTGYGSGIVKDLNDAHESAVKEAESDAMKRALMTLGNPFGLALYDKDKANVGIDEEPFDAAATALRIEGLLRSATDKSEIAQIWNFDSREDRARLKREAPAIYKALTETLTFEQQRVSPPAGADVPANELTH